MQLEHLETQQFASALGLSAQAWPLDAPETRAFRRIAGLLARPLRIGLVGERRAGKSTLLNILVGAEVFPAETLGKPYLLHVRHGEEMRVDKVNRTRERESLTPESFRSAIAASEPEQAQTSKVIYRSRALNNTAIHDQFEGDKSGHHFEISFPFPVLREAEIIEMPVDALNGRKSYPNSLFHVDMAIWISHAAQAWKHSEFRAWSEGKYCVPSRSILVVTNGEALPSMDKTRLMARLKEETTDLFAERYVVSSKHAESLLLTRRNISSAEWIETGFYHLEGAIQTVIMSVRRERLARAKQLCKRLESRSSKRDKTIAGQLTSTRNTLAYEARLDNGNAS